MDCGYPMNRFARQISLAEIGEAGQAKLANAELLIVGAGGLGSSAMQYLAGAGIGRIRIVDPDLVELTNLHRQPIFQEADMGKPKAMAAAARLRALNSDLKAEPVVCPLNPGNVHALLGNADAALDCADNFAVSYTLSDACHEIGMPLISASALEFSGYAGAFCGGAPSLRAVFPELPERSVNCATAGVSGPVVGLLGCCQAQMAISLLLELDPSPLGRLVRFDGRTFRFAEFDFSSADEPPAGGFAFTTLADVSADDFFAELRSVGEAPVAAVGHARRLSAESFGEGGLRPVPGQRAIMCCRTGLRAWNAANRLSAEWDGDIRLIATANEDEGTTASGPVDNRREDEVLPSGT